MLDCDLCGTTVLDGDEVHIHCPECMDKMTDGHYLEKLLRRWLAVGADISKYQIDKAELRSLKKETKAILVEE